MKKDLLLQEREWVCPKGGTKYNRDMSPAINLAELGKTIPMQCGKLLSVDIAALALGNEGETAVGKPATGDTVRVFHGMKCRNIDKHLASLGLYL